MRNEEHYEGAVVIVTDGGVQPETLVIKAGHHTPRASAIFRSGVCMYMCVNIYVWERE